MSLKTMFVNNNKNNSSTRFKINDEFEAILESDNLLEQYSKLSFKNQYYLNEYIKNKLFKSKTK